MDDRVIRPSFAFEWPLFARPLNTNLSQGLCGLDRAEKGDLVGVGLYHEISGSSIRGADTMRGYALVGTDDGRSCDLSTLSPTPNTKHHIQLIEWGILCNDPPARILHGVLGNLGNGFEIIHLAGFTVAITFKNRGLKRDVADILIVANPARDAQDADKRISEIRVLFALLGKWHLFLSRYRYELPTSDMLLRAARRFSSPVITG